MSLIFSFNCFISLVAENLGDDEAGDKADNLRVMLFISFSTSLVFSPICFKSVNVDSFSFNCFLSLEGVNDLDDGFGDRGF